MGLNRASKNDFWQVGLAVFGRISGWVAGPVIIALFLGRFLDARYSTKPWFFLGLTALAFVVSTVGIIREAGSYLRDIEVKAKQDEYTKRTTEK